LKGNSELPTPDSELLRYTMDLPLRASLDEIFFELTRTDPQGRLDLPRKILFWGEGAGEISSYVAGWIAGQGIEAIVLDGANRFDPYIISSFAKRVSLLPENLLKKIRIARAFTCYQMATLVAERLGSLLQKEGSIAQQHKPWVILLGPITPFLDEDVPDREVRPLFERALRKVESMAMEGMNFFLFQPNSPSSPSVSSRTDFAKGGVGGLVGSRRAFLTRRLFQISDMVWKVCLDDEGPKMILEKSVEPNIIENCKLQNEKCKFVRKGLKCLSISR
jgi:hypothetical protein